MRSKKKEILKLIELLEQPHDSVEDLANTIWKTIDQLRQEHEAYVVAVKHENPLLLVYGIYDTENSAKKDLERYRSTTGGERCAILRLCSPTKMFAGEQIEFR